MRDTTRQETLEVHADPRLPTLSALYAVERQDLANLSNVALALVGAALAYLVSSVFGLSQAEHVRGVSVLWSLAPLPLFAMSAFHVQIVALSMARTDSCRRMEARLAAAAGLDAAGFGTCLSDTIMDPDRARWPFARAAKLTYGGVGAVIAGLTIVCLVNAAATGAHPAWLTVVFIAYLVIAGTVLQPAWSHLRVPVRRRKARPGR